MPIGYVAVDDETDYPHSFLVAPMQCSAEAGVVCRVCLVQW